MCSTRRFGGTYPKNEIMASAIQHAIPTYGIANIASSSPERNIDAAVQISAATGVTRIRRTVGNIDGIPDTKNTSSNDSQDRDDDRSLYFSGNT